MKTISGRFFPVAAFQLIVFLWLSSFSLPAETTAGETPAPHFSIGLAAGYFYPLQSSFREIYSKPLLPVELQLDWALGRRVSVFAAARQLKASGNTVLLVPQQPEETYALSWRMTTLRLGANYMFGSSRFTPFIGAGGSYHFYRERWLDAPPVTEGRKTGFFIQAGGRYRWQRRWQAHVQLDYSSIPAGSGARGPVNLGGLSLFLGLLLGIF